MDFNSTEKRIRELVHLVPIDFTEMSYIVNLIAPERFVDPYFPPTRYSLHGSSQERLDCQVIWRRPEEFLGHSMQVFAAGVESADINQGQLGNCWFLSALASLANAEFYVTRLFESHELSPIGLYRIKICKNAEWVNVVVDDLIPCDRDTGEPVFSKNNGAELWVLLLEKAYAKLNCSYFSLKGGFAADAFMDLTGAPAFSYYFDEYSEQIESGEFWGWLED